MKIKTASINNLLTEKLRDATTQGDTLTLVANPLAGGTPRWELRDKDNVALLGSLDKDLLFKIARMVKVKVVEDG